MDKLLHAGTSLDPSWFRFAGRTLEPGHVKRLLSPYLTAERGRRIEQVLNDRTYSLAVVAEGVVDTGNVAAIMRSADAFGVQAFHVIDVADGFKFSKRTARGAAKWLDRHRWSTAHQCTQHLAAGGYRILAADASLDATPLEDVDFSTPTALVFGNEQAGLSDEVMAATHSTVTIPMAGFTRSLNVSVAAGVALHHAYQDRVSRLGRHGDLSDLDRNRLRAVFTMKSVRHHRELIERLLAQEGAAGPGGNTVQT